MTKWKIKHEKFDDRDKLGRRSKFAVSDLTREKIRQSNTGKSPTQETRQKMSELRRGRSNTKLRSSLETVLSKFKETHGDKYDYSKVEYVNTNTRIEVICKKCNISFFPTPNNHKRGSGCPECAIRRNAKKKSEEMKNRLSTPEGRELYGKFLNSGRGHQKNV